MARKSSAQGRCVLGTICPGEYVLLSERAGRKPRYGLRGQRRTAEPRNGTTRAPGSLPVPGSWEHDQRRPSELRTGRQQAAQIRLAKLASDAHAAGWLLVARRADALQQFVDQRTR